MPGISQAQALTVIDQKLHRGLILRQNYWWVGLSRFLEAARLISMVMRWKYREDAGLYIVPIVPDVELRCGLKPLTTSEWFLGRRTALADLYPVALKIANRQETFVGWIGDRAPWVSQYCRGYQHQLAIAGAIVDIDKWQFFTQFFSFVNTWILG
jgi:hypothetical protein